MFFISKIVALFSQPLHWVVAMLVLALIKAAEAPKTARLFTNGALVLLLAIGWVSIPDLFIRPMEQRYAEMSPDADLQGFDGIVVLGGAMQAGYIAMDHNQPLLTDAAGRMTAAVAIAQKYPSMPIVFTGGEGDFFGTGPSEAQRASHFFTTMHLTGSRIVLEDQSRNTYENAVFTAQLAGINKHNRWLLVTSAWHMPRAMATFEKAGWNVTAYPVDFRTGNNTPLTRYSLVMGADHWQLVLRETIGLAAYRLLGRL
jgi:uncharacterized SAM-binding protein YcdF (DUF218 family)